jgi:hypothetical protein
LISTLQRDPNVTLVAKFGPDFIFLNRASSPAVSVDGYVPVSKNYTLFYGVHPLSYNATAWGIGELAGASVHPLSYAASPWSWTSWANYSDLSVGSDDVSFYVYFHNVPGVTWPFFQANTEVRPPVDTAKFPYLVINFTSSIPCRIQFEAHNASGSLFYPSLTFNFTEGKNHIYAFSMAGEGNVTQLSLLVFTPRNSTLNMRVNSISVDALAFRGNGVGALSVGLFDPADTVTVNGSESEPVVAARLESYAVVNPTSVRLTVFASAPGNFSIVLWQSYDKGWLLEGKGGIPYPDAKRVEVNGMFNGWIVSVPRSGNYTFTISYAPQRSLTLAYELSAISAAGLAVAYALSRRRGGRNGGLPPPSSSSDTDRQVPTSHASEPRKAFPT